MGACEGDLGRAAGREAAALRTPRGGAERVRGTCKAGGALAWHAIDNIRRTGGRQHVAHTRTARTTHLRSKRPCGLSLAFHPHWLAAAPAAAMAHRCHICTRTGLTPATAATHLCCHGLLFACSQKIPSIKIDGSVPSKVCLRLSPFHPLSAPSHLWHSLADTASTSPGLQCRVPYLRWAVRQDRHELVKSFQEEGSRMRLAVLSISAAGQGGQPRQHMQHERGNTQHYNMNAQHAAVRHAACSMRRASASLRHRRRPTWASATLRRCSRAL